MGSLEVRLTTHDRGQIFAQNGGRSTYVGSTFWANAIPQEVRLW